MNAAIKRGWDETINLFLGEDYNLKPDVSSLNAAIKRGSKAIINLLLGDQHKVKPDVSSLNTAIEHKKTDIAINLIKTHKVEPNQESRNAYQKNSRFYEVFKRKKNNLKPLLFKKEENKKKKKTSLKGKETSSRSSQKITALGILLFLLGIGGVVFKVRAKKKKECAEKSKPAPKKTEAPSQSERKPEDSSSQRRFHQHDPKQQ